MVVWCGAGISIPSGMPGAVELVKALLARTRLTPKQRDQIANIVPNRLPFERLMEVVLDAMDEPAQRSLLKLFRLGQPNAYHMFLAALAKQGLVRTFYTTNFDTHIETALDRVKLQREKDYEVWHEPDRFGEIDWQREIIRVIKLHGSVEEVDKMGVTVRRVAFPGSETHLRMMIDHVFQNGSHNSVLVMGYSFSDRFDISPAVRKCAARC